MIRVALAGGRGYVGQELLQLLLAIPEYEVVYVGSRSLAGQPVARTYPQLPADWTFQDLSHASMTACGADAWVLAQPNGQAGMLWDQIASTDAKVIDISSDFRFSDEWVYGLPEKNQTCICDATRVANPGCYATAAQLALLPVIDRVQGWPQAFGISGFSGAGRTPNEKNDPARLANNILPYSLAGHTHELEISRQLNHPVRFLPHVAPFFRGINMTVSLMLQQATSVEQLLMEFQEYYAAFPLVDVVPEIPQIRQVTDTNRAMIGGFTVDAREDRNRLAIVCVIDNLRKGAASQVIQNLNLMFGLPSERGLLP